MITQDKYSYTINTLKNGLRVLHIPNHSSSAVYVSFTGMAGYRAETESEYGVAHFLEHLMLDGTLRFPSAYKINEYLENYGALHNAMTSNETVEYFVKILPKYSEIAFDFISDIILNSLLDEVEKEKKVVKEETSLKADRPEAILYRQEIKTIFPRGSINHNLLEAETNLNSIDRNILKTFLKTHYNSSNFILVVSGDISLPETIKLAEKYFSVIPQGRIYKYDQAVFNPKETIDIFHHPLSQSRLVISYKGFPENSPESDIAALFAHILGGSNSQTSRLFNQLRHQNHLVYSANSYHNTYSDIGHFEICVNAQEDNIQKSLDTVFEELKKVLDHSINQTEIDKAKKSLLSKYFFSADGPANIAGEYSYQLLASQKIVTPVQYEDIINSITANQLLKIAHKIFSDPPKINLITPKLDNLKINF
jgi:predicted Zn-dependent peptidase